MVIIYGKYAVQFACFKDTKKHEAISQNYSATPTEVGPAAEWYFSPTKLLMALILNLSGETVIVGESIAPKCSRLLFLVCHLTTGPHWPEHVWSIVVSTPGHGASGPWGPSWPRPPSASQQWVPPEGEPLSGQVLPLSSSSAPPPALESLPADHEWWPPPLLSWASPGRGVLCWGAADSQKQRSLQ